MLSSWRSQPVRSQHAAKLIYLQWHDLHATNGALYVSRAWKDGAYSPPKTENGVRWVEVPKTLMDELRRWQTELRNIKVPVEGHDRSSRPAEASRSRTPTSSSAGGTRR
jgi:hypothetical protein